MNTPTKLNNQPDMKATSKFFHMKTDTQEFIVRVESLINHEEDAAAAVAEHITSPINFCREVDGEVACIKQMMGVQLVDPELQPA